MSIKKISPKHDLQIFDLINSNNISSLKKALKDQKLNINARNHEGATPLIIASANGNLEIVKLLLKYGAKLESKNNSSSNALMHAILYSRNVIAKLLVEAGTNLSVKNYHGYTAMDLACQEKNIEIVKFLLEQGAPVNSRTTKKVTPLMQSAVEGASDIFKLLIEWKADLSLRDNRNNSIMHYAAVGGKIDILKYAIENKININDKNKYGYTPLMCVSKGKRSINIAKTLIKLGANINIKSNDGYSAFMMACIYGSINLVKFFLTHNVSIIEINNLGEYSLIFAIKRKSHQLIQILLDYALKNGKLFEPRHIGKALMMAYNYQQNIAFKALLEYENNYIEHNENNVYAGIQEEGYQSISKKKNSKFYIFYHLDIIAES